MTKGEKPTRPNTLNLLNKIDTTATNKSLDILKNNLKTESKTPPPPPPRWSKPATPQSNNNNNNNFTVTTTVTFSVNSQSPKSENLPEVVVCDPKRMSPEGQCTSTVSSSKGGSLRREQVTSPNGSVLSPNSDPSSLLSPDTLSPLSAAKTTRHSRRRHKVKQNSPPILMVHITYMF